MHILCTLLHIGGMSLPRIRCVYCGSPGRLSVCRGCARDRRPTELQRWLSSRHVTMTGLADRCGCTYRTILNAAHGARLSGDIAIKISRATGISLETLLRGTHGPERQGVDRGAPGAGPHERAESPGASGQHVSGAGRFDHGNRGERDHELSESDPAGRRRWR